MKVVINSCYGGYGLSETAMLKYAEIKGIKIYIKKYKSMTFYYTTETFEEESFLSEDKIDRNDPALVETVEILGEEANGDFAKLKVVEIPDDIEWTIEEYDGIEHVAEVHRIWE